jgi:hypothetical protein
MKRLGFASISLLLAACGGNMPEGALEYRYLLADIVSVPESPCAGDDVRLMVVPTYDEPRLQTLIDGEEGDRVIRTFEKPGPRAVQAHATIPGVAMDTRAVTIDVRDCGVRPRLEVTMREVPGRKDAVALSVNAWSAMGDPVSVRWDFGDGTSQGGTQRSVEKSYALRPQKGPRSRFEIAVVAEDAAGNTATRRLSVAFENDARQGGIARLPAELDRFAKRVPEGRRALVRLKNILGERVYFAMLEVNALRCDGGPDARSEWALGDGFTSPPKALVSGQIWSGWLTLSPQMAPDNACRAKIRLTGTTEAGTPVVSEALIELSPPAGTVVTDAATIDDVRRVQALLGRRQVTAEEVERLR